MRSQICTHLAALECLAIYKIAYIFLIHKTRFVVYIVSSQLDHNQRVWTITQFMLYSINSNSKDLN
jgi:hypothetical protein